MMMSEVIRCRLPQSLSPIDASEDERRDRCERGEEQNDGHDLSPASRPPRQPMPVRLDGGQPWPMPDVVRAVVRAYELPHERLHTADDFAEDRAA